MSWSKYRNGKENVINFRRLCYSTIHYVPKWQPVKNEQRPLGVEKLQNTYNTSSLNVAIVERHLIWTVTIKSVGSSPWQSSKKRMTQRRGAVGKERTFPSSSLTNHWTEKLFYERVKCMGWFYDVYKILFRVRFQIWYMIRIVLIGIKLSLNVQLFVHNTAQE